MTQRIIVLAILIGVMVVIVHTEIIGRGNHLSPTLVLGFLLLAAYSTGFVLEKVKLPKITGYIVAGIVFGPHVLHLTPSESIVDLSFINSLALAFIAFCAGGELKISSIKKQFKSILLLVVSQTLVVFVGVECIVQKTSTLFEPIKFGN
jgi:Kef-type K+ transport system membrane component KefB